MDNLCRPQRLICTFIFYVDPVDNLFADSCLGDSGGPLQFLEFINDEVRYVQHGIVSFGFKKCAVEGYPGVYVRLVYYLDWILDNMKE